MFRLRFGQIATSHGITQFAAERVPIRVTADYPMSEVQRVCAKLPPVPTVIARLIAYFFVGVLYAVGPLLLLIAIVSSIPKVEFVRNSVASHGTIIGIQSVYSRRFSKEVYKPVVRFTDSNGQTHLFLAVSRAGLVPLKPGDSVRVLYLKDHPETARVDSIAQLWMPQPILALIGAVFVTFSVRILIRRRLI